MINLVMFKVAMLFVKQVKPDHLGIKDFRSLITLIQDYFHFDEDLIRDYLINKDILYLLIDKERDNMIVGLVGCRYLECDNYYIIYVGTTVVEPQYQRNGFLYNVLFDQVIKAYLKHPFKEKYITASLTTAKVYNALRNFKRCYPRDDAKAPPEVLTVMDEVLKQVLPHAEHIRDGDVCIIRALRYKNFRAPFVEKDVCSHNGYFEKVNPNYIMGDQLLIASNVYISGFLQLAFMNMVSKVKKQLRKWGLMRV